MVKSQDDLEETGVQRLRNLNGVQEGKGERHRCSWWNTTYVEGFWSQEELELPDVPKG